MISAKRQKEDDQIMEEYLKNRPTVNDAVILKENDDKIPLYIDNFIDWLGRHYPLKFALPDTKNLYYLNIIYDLKIFAAQIILLNKEDQLLNKNSVLIKKVPFKQDIYSTLQDTKFYINLVSHKSITNRDGSTAVDPYEILKYWCLPERKLMQYQESKEKWQHFDFFNIGRKANGQYGGKDIYFGFKERMYSKSGEKFNITIYLSYLDPSDEDIIKITTKRKLNEKLIKNGLNDIGDFGYYLINVLSIEIEKVTLERNAYIQIKMASELITPDDYFATIGHYKASWQKICVEKKFSAKGLRKIGTELQIKRINKYTDDELCEVIGERVLTLQWSDFE